MPSVPFMRLVGLFIGDGHLSNSNHLVFNIRKEREIAFLREATGEARLQLKRWAHAFAVPVSPEMRELFARCYGGGEKVIPRSLLGLGVPLLEALLDSLMNSDGKRCAVRPGRVDRQTYSTTSARLADQVQELALKLGRSASVRPHRAAEADGHFGRKPRWRVTVYSGRNTRPTPVEGGGDRAHGRRAIRRLDPLRRGPEPDALRQKERLRRVVRQHAVRARRFRFHVRCPIFVAREWFRHRIGSFNEFSMRYAKATDDFYVPAAEDVRSQVGKPGAYTFESVDPELAESTRETLESVYRTAYDAYEQLVESGHRARDRALRPSGRRLHGVLLDGERPRADELRLAARGGHGAARDPPLRRGRRVVPAEKMPVTYEAFVANDRTAP